MRGHKTRDVSCAGFEFSGLRDPTADFAAATTEYWSGFGLSTWNMKVGGAYCNILSGLQLRENFSQHRKNLGSAWLAYRMVGVTLHQVVNAVAGGISRLL